MTEETSTAAEPTQPPEAQPETESAPVQPAESAPPTEQPGAEVQAETIPKKRFNEVYWEKKEAERKAQELERKLSELQQTRQPPEPEAPQSDKPQLADFDYDDAKYLDALTDWKLEQREKQREQERQKTQQQERLGSFVQRQAAYAAGNSEYDAAIKQADAAGISFSEGVSEVILTADNGVELHHELLKSPELIDKLNRMTPVQAAMELGRLEARLKSTPAPAITSAPDPIAGLNGAGSQLTPGGASESMADYYARRTKERAERGRF